MRKIILLLPILLIACSDKPVVPKIPLKDTVITLDSFSSIKKVEAALEHTSGLEHEIKKTYKTKEALLKENQILKQEIRIVKDSLVRVVNKLPKKKNLIQRVFNIAPDSIEVVTVDTLR